jgi:hypothetical protein
MAPHSENKYTVGAKLSDLTSRVTSLEKENAELRTHLAGKLETLVNDARNIIQGQIKIPRDGKDGCNGVDGATGATGVKGDRGDCTIPNDSEVAAALLVIRQKHARALAMIQAALEANSKRKHSGAKVVLDAELKTIEASLR